MAAPVVLVTSAPPAKAEYRREFLTCLAAPEHQWASFTYRAKWIDPSLLEDRRLDGRAAILVFADVPGGVGEEFEFAAFRHATIRGIRPSDVVNRKLYDDDTYLGVDFQLGRHVHVAPNDVARQVADWTQAIRALEHRPRPSTKEGVGTRFMFSHDAPPAESVPVESATSWRALSQWLAHRHSLDGSYFFRVRELRSIKAHQPLAPATNGGRLHYELLTRGEYYLELDAYSKVATPVFADAVEARATSERLLVDNPQTTTIGTGVGATITITAGPVQTAVSTTLVLCGREHVEDKAPRLELPMRISPRRMLVWWLAVMIAVGTATSGLSKTDLGVSTITTIGIKGVGIALIVAALFIAAGRAPGVSK